MHVDKTSYISSFSFYTIDNIDKFEEFLLTCFEIFFTSLEIVDKNMLSIFRIDANSIVDFFWGERGKCPRFYSEGIDAKKPTICFLFSEIFFKKIIIQRFIK
jgi:hypothetical protein